MDAKTAENLMSLAADGRMSAADVLALRRTVFPDGVVSRQELELLFALGERAPQGDPAWPHLFAEMCADFFLNEEEPEGYLSDEEFAYLKALVTRDGHTASSLELGALIDLVNKARIVSADMTAFIGDQIRSLISSRETPTIGEQDVALLQRYLYAAGGEVDIGISRAEADLLFDLHDATVDADNASAWRELFVKAIAAHLMQHVGYTPLERSEALRLTEWSKDTSRSTGGFFGSMVSGGLKAIIDAYTAPSAWQERNAQADTAMTVARAVTDDEAAWLVRRIGQNRQLDEAELALLVYMRDHLGADLPGPLAELVALAPARSAA
ncbi:MAG: hypothetical protein KI785_00955 [Devosiaceae bacterium]|nr:hypothetical protein [Devosiaceae bacterium MH13]